MGFQIQKVHRISVFYCILINVHIFANEVPSSPSPRNNQIIYFPGRMRTNNSSHTRIGNSLFTLGIYLFSYTHSHVLCWITNEAVFCSMFDWNYFRSWFWNTLPLCILIAIIFRRQERHLIKKKHFCFSDPLSQHTFVANVTQCAENDQTFCTKNDNYPAEYVRRLLQEHSHRFADSFVSDLDTNEVSIRVDNFDVEHLCDSYQKVIYPTSGLTKDGNERYIVNTDDYKQGVRVSLCRKSGQACKMADIFPVGYKTECHQQMVYRELVSLGTGGQFIKNHFEFPACCTCILHRG